MVGTMIAAIVVAADATSASADAPPVVAIEPPTEVTYTAAKVHGTINPEGGPSTVSYHWEYTEAGAPWPNWAAFGEISGSAAEGTTPIALEAQLEGLKAGKEYSVRLVAENWAATGRVESAQETFTTEATTRASVTIDPVGAVGSDTVELSGAVNPEAPAGDPSAFDVDWHFRCTPSCSSTGGTIAADSSSHPVSETINRLEPNTHYEAELVAINAGSETSAGPVSFTTDAATPVARTVPAYVSPITGNAVLGAQINPKNSPTTFKFEYGPTESYGQTVPDSGELDAGSAGVLSFVTQDLSDLPAEATYHYRVEATNQAGTTYGHDMVFQTAPSPEPETCPNEQFRTGWSEGLPDCRAYEQVSPPDKNNSDAQRLWGRASVTGDKVAWIADGSFAGLKMAPSLSANYMSTRGVSGWTTEGIYPPMVDNGWLNAGYVGFTDDLSKGYFRWRDLPEHPVVPGAPGGDWWNMHMYLRDNESGTFHLVSGTNDEAGNVWAGIGGTASADLSHIAFESNREDVPGAPCRAKGLEANEPICIYEWENGNLSLVSVDPSGNPVSARLGAEGQPTEHPMSDDGSRLYFSSPPQNPTTLYMRENGERTIEVSAPERTDAGGLSGQGIGFSGAEAAHGAKALFLTSDTLVDSDTDTTQDLYIYDRNAPEGERLTLVSANMNPALTGGAEAIGVVATSSDLSRVYFVAAKQIVAGEPETAGPMLFEWEFNDGTPSVSYLGPLDESDAQMWRLSMVDNTGQRWKPAFVSANGRFLAFRSAGRLTAFNNEGAREIYLYDAVRQELRCVSCREGLASGGGFIDFQASETSSLTRGETLPENQIRPVTNGGQVFFNTSRPLTHGDGNGRSDVYEYENGQVHLLSTGAGTKDAYFLEADASGKNVFFTTVNRLVGWDKDENNDVYDARTDGGFPEPARVVECTGEGCRGIPSEPPASPTLGSATFVGHLARGRHHRRPKQRRHRHRQHHRHRK